MLARQDERQASMGEVERARMEALVRAESALRNLQYGKVVITVQGGKPVLVETHQQERIG